MTKNKIFNNLFIDAAYCLYLEEFQDRKEKALNEFNKQKIEVNMFKGTYLPDNGWLGCKLGHINIIKDAKKNKYKNILICEDNVKFMVDLPINIFIPNDFGIFYLSYYDIDNLSFYDKRIANNNYDFLRLFYARNTNSYILNEKAYDIILSSEQVNNDYKFIDMFYGVIVQNKYPCYGIYPIIVDINDISSTICKNNKENIEKFKNDIFYKAKITLEKDVDEKIYDIIDSNDVFFYNDIIYNNFTKYYINSNKLIIFYINLEERTDRCIEMEKSFKKLNIHNYERINSIEGKKIACPKLFIPFCQNNYISNGAYGCYLTHKKCYENFLKLEQKYVLILEDDIYFLENFHEKFQRALEIIDKIEDFDFLYLSRSDIFFETMYEYNPEMYNDNILYSPICCGYGFHSYLLSKNGAIKYLKILNNFENNYWVKNTGVPIDCLDYFKNYGMSININLNIYALKEDLIKTMPSYSDTSY
jgi:GR25 family glycosyltransferase involved in LPS biosynthesis